MKPLSRARREREEQLQQGGGAIPRNSSIGSAATSAGSLGSSSRGSAGGAAAMQRPSRPPRLPIRQVPGNAWDFPGSIPEDRVDAGTSTASDGVMQNRLEEAKTPTESTASSGESWFASLFRSASLR